MLKEKFGIKVISALEPIADDEGGEFYEMFLEWNAEKYSKRLSKRIKDGIDTSIANGMFCGGKVPFGYRLEIEQTPGSGKPIKKVVVHEEETEIICCTESGCFFVIYTNHPEGVLRGDCVLILLFKYFLIAWASSAKDFFLTVNHIMENKTFSPRILFGRICEIFYSRIIEIFC